MRMPNKRTRTHIIHFDFDLVCFAFRLRFCSHTSTFADPFSFRRNRHAHMQMDKRTKNNNECANRMRAAATARKMSAENRFANKFKFGIPDCLNVCLKQWFVERVRVNACMREWILRSVFFECGLKIPNATQFNAYIFIDECLSLWVPAPVGFDVKSMKSI